MAPKHRAKAPSKSKSKSKSKPLPPQRTAGPSTNMATDANTETMTARHVVRSNNRRLGMVLWCTLICGIAQFSTLVFTQAGADYWWMPWRAPATGAATTTAKASSPGVPDMLRLQSPANAPLAAEDQVPSHHLRMPATNQQQQIQRDGNVTQGTDAHGHARSPSSQNHAKPAQSQANITKSAADQQLTQHEISRIIRIFQKAMKAKIYYQTQSWNLLAGSDLDTRVDVPSWSSFAQGDQDPQIHDMLQQYPQLERQREMAWSSFDSMRQQQQGKAADGRIPSDGEDLVIWDNEKDIGTYFDHLIHNCGDSFNATEDSTFQHRCWDSVLHLANAPRCTTQLDSTFECDGRAADSIDTSITGTVQPSQLPSLRRHDPEQLIRDHFLSKENSINVVIIGAGPAGLFLANIMSYLRLVEVPMRIVIFEKRTSQVGRKKPYIRNWLTEIPASSFYHADSRILRFLQAVHNDRCEDIVTKPDNPYANLDHAAALKQCEEDKWGKHTSLPIRFHETLLLISNRQRGVKFIYEDVESYKEMLASMPNMIVFDASGHRMDKLNRPPGRNPINGEPSPNINVAQWSSTHGAGYDTLLGEANIGGIGEPIYELLRKEQARARVARYESDQGVLLYPVTKGDHKPFAVRMLKINDFRHTRYENGFNFQYRSSISAVMLSQHEFCTLCGKDRQLAGCSKICRLNWTWDTINKYRSDVARRLNDESPGFSTTVSVFTLTTQQHDAMMYITKGGSTPMPLESLPLSAMKYDPIMRENNFFQALKFYASYAGGIDYPLVSVFSFVPYMYADPLVPMTAVTKARIGDAPLLRVGDSMWTGNPNWANGLTRHLSTLRSFAKMMHPIIVADDDDDGV